MSEVYSGQDEWKIKPAKSYKKLYAPRKIKQKYYTNSSLHKQQQIFTHITAEHSFILTLGRGSVNLGLQFA